MLELAIAEAYRSRPRPRPHPPTAARQQPALTVPSRPPTAAPQHPATTVPLRPASFATNPNARASFSSSRRRTPAISSRNASVTSHSRSFISFIARRGHPGSSSSSSSVTITPQGTVRADSVFSHVTASRASDVLPTFRKDVKELPKPNQTAAACSPRTNPSPTRPALDLPALPPPVPLPPQEELTHFDTALQSAIEDLHPPPSGRDTALTVLSHVAYISDLACCIATSWPEYYHLLLHAAKLVISVPPAREMAARNALARCLAAIARRWEGEEKRVTTEIARVAGSVFDDAVQERRMLASRLGGEFARWLSGQFGRPSSSAIDRRSIRILTLGVSRAVSVGLQYALAEDPGLSIHLGVLTALDQGLPAPPSYERLHITVYPTSAIGTASRDVDILILEPSWISAAGDLGCQNGALGTAVCVKTLSPSAKVVALGGGDSIVISVAEGLTACEICDGINDTPERVPSKFVDLCIAENGALNIEELQGLAEAAGQLQRHVLDEDGA